MVPDPTPRWDPLLYSGAAVHYAVGRLPYPTDLAVGFADALGLDGTGRLLDVGCGPGSLTLLLAPWFAESVGLDPDPGMIAEAERLAAEQQLTGVRFVNRTAEELPADLAPVDVITFAQSFHWMDRPRVARAAHAMLAPGGVCAHVHAATHQGEASVDHPDPPTPPHEQITELVRRYLGPVRRAGSGSLPGDPPSGEGEIYRAAGFTGPRRFEVPGRPLVRSTDQVVAAVFSLSSAAPHLFGDRVAAFEDDLRSLLAASSSTGSFTELQAPIAVDLWSR